MHDRNRRMIVRDFVGNGRNRRRSRSTSPSGVGVGEARRRGDGGSSLVLALIYIVTISTVVLALATWTTGDLLSSTKFNNASQFDTALRSITELGIQNIRYQPLYSTTDQTLNEVGACWSPASGTMASQVINGYSLAVWCETQAAPTGQVESAASRVVTLFACPTTITTGAACKLTPSVTAVVTFDDYQAANSAPLTQVCTYPNCGFSATINSWLWGSTAGGVPVPSTTIPYSVGSAAQLAFTVSPVAGGEGVSFTTNPQVTVEDANGYMVTGDTSNVVISITHFTASSTGGTQGTLSGCAQNSEVNGVVSFSNCSIGGPGAAGTYALTASDGGLQIATANVTISAGAATKLVFSTNPVAGVAEGVSFNTNPQVSVEDANGNVVTNDASTISLSITGATTQVLNGCVKTTETGGVESFSSCTVTGPAAVAGGPYTLTASEPGLTSAQSASFAIVPGSASELIFATKPPATVVQTSGTLSFSVSVADAYGNPVTATNQNDSITVAGTGLTGTRTAVASGGTANFSGLSMTSPGLQTITASDGSLSGTASVSVYGLVASGSPTNTNSTTQNLSGVGTTSGDPLLVLVTYYATSTTTPTCNKPTGTAVSGTVNVLAAQSQWSGTTSPYFGYCAYSTTVGTASGGLTEAMTNVTGTDYMQIEVVEVTGAPAVFPTNGLTAYGSPNTQTTTTRYYPGSSTAGDTEIIVAAGTNSSTTTPVFTEPSGFHQLANSGGWGVTGAKFDVNVGAGPISAPYASGSVSPSSTYGTYGIDLTP